METSSIVLRESFLRGEFIVGWPYFWRNLFVYFSHVSLEFSEGVWVVISFLEEVVLENSIFLDRRGELH